MAVVAIPTKNEQNEVREFINAIDEEDFDEIMVIGIKDGGIYPMWSRGTSLVHALGLIEVLKSDLIDSFVSKGGTGT